LYLTVCLEKPIQSAVDSLCYIALNWADISPLPPNAKKFAIAMGTEQSISKEIQHLKLDL